MNATDTKTYRGRTLEEVLPKIKAELGPDAEIVRQRTGLTGGGGGFFPRQMVEIEGRPSGSTPHPVDPPTAEGLTAPGIQEILRQAAPFAEHLGAAERRLEPEVRSEPEP